MKLFVNIPVTDLENRSNFSQNLALSLIHSLPMKKLPF